MTTPLRFEGGGPNVAQDTLIFRVSSEGFSLAGGSGRGVGWNGIVDLPASGESLAARVHQSGQAARVGGDAEPVRIIGPYWARFAVLIPVSGDHLVVFGGPEPISPTDTMLLPVAANAVANLGQISPAKLLADELEVVHAIRALMDYRPEMLSETARHIARFAAEPLSCEVGAILVRHQGATIAEVVTLDWPTRLEPDAIRDSLVSLFERTGSGSVLEQELEAGAVDALGRDHGLVARFAIPIGSPNPFGVLVVAHAAERSRGFTNLCQRIGNALAQAAESLLIQAISREELTAERDRFAREARLDPLTGIENRTAWDDIVKVEEARRQRNPTPVSVISADLDNLKATNDRDGHAAGDEIIKATARLLRNEARTSDRVARVGGDEFLIMLPETDAAGAARFVARVRATARRVRANGLPAVVLSVGAATSPPGEPLRDAIDRADSAMYNDKKRRAMTRSKAKGDHAS
ncbi:MAG: GGDEF domain-containing protein [Chloroflexota bacterium]